MRYSALTKIGNNERLARFDDAANENENVELSTYVTMTGLSCTCGEGRNSGTVERGDFARKIESKVWKKICSFEKE